MRQYYILI